MLLNEIGFFQLDNLIKNRVPFLLANFSENISSKYTSIYHQHIKNYEFSFKNEDEFLLFLKEKNHAKDSAIVLLCFDGKLSNKLCSDLIKLSYTNIYYIKDGYQQLLLDWES